MFLACLDQTEDSIQIVVEEDLIGKANGHFEFMLKRIFIIESKKDGMGQEMVQDLVGMEVASDLNRCLTQIEYFPKTLPEAHPQSWIVPYNF